MQSVVSKARSFIANHGTSLQKAASDFLFNAAPKELLVEELGRYQNNDGGWAKGLEAEYQGDVSSAMTTATALSYMYLFDLQDTPLFENTVNWLEERQQSNGSWDESMEILQHEVPPYMQPGASIEYLTGMLFKWLKLHGVDKTSMLNKAEEFLVKRFPTVQSNPNFWAAIGYANAFSTIPQHELAPKVFAWVQEILNPKCSDSPETTGLTWQQVQGLIYDNDPLLAHLEAEVLEAIRKNQQADGSWPHQFGTYNQVWAAVHILRYLKQKGFTE